MEINKEIQSRNKKNPGLKLQLIELRGERAFNELTLDMLGTTEYNLGGKDILTGVSSYIEVN